MTEDIKKMIINALSENLGVEPEDINDDDSLEQDLHMRVIDISDLIDKLNTMGIETDNVKFEEIETVMDLVEALEG